MTSTSKKRRRFSLGILFATLALLGSVRSDDLRHVFNNAANHNTPYHQRDLITINDHAWYDGHYSTIISVESILQTGKVEESAPLNVAAYLMDVNMEIDWQADDAFIRAFHDIENRIAEQIIASAYLQALMNKQQWDKDDRVAWDRTICRMVSAALRDTPGLDEYRSDCFGDMEDRVGRTSRLNDLSADIENGTYEKEFDCEGMSVVKGCLMQRLANRFFDADRAPSYFFVCGKGDLSTGDNRGPGGHAYIVSQSDGEIIGVIEATARYGGFEALSRDYSFAEFAKGTPLVDRWGAVYGFDLRESDVRKAREEAGFIADISPSPSIIFLPPSV